MTWRPWREAVLEGAEETGIYREDGVLWPMEYRTGGSTAARDNVLYHVAGYVSRFLESQDLGEDVGNDCSEWDILAYLYEIMVEEGTFQKVLDHIERNGWGCALP